MNRATTTNPVASRAAALGVLAAAVVLGWAILAEPYRALLAGQEAELQQGRDRLAHLTRIAGTVPGLADALEQGAAAGERLTDPYLPGASDSLAAATLQGHLGEMAQRAGMSVTSVEPAPAAEAADSGRVALTLSLNGAIDGMQRLLHAIESQRPLLFVEEIDILNPSVTEARFDPAGHVLVGVRLRVAGYRRVP